MKKLTTHTRTHSLRKYQVWNKTSDGYTLIGTHKTAHEAKAYITESKKSGLHITVRVPQEEL